MTTSNPLSQLLLASALLLAFSSCSPKTVTHPIFKTVASPLLKDNRISMQAQPNGYAWMQQDEIRVYLNRNDLHNMQKALHSFPAWNDIARSSGISTEQTMFNVERNGIEAGIDFHSQSGRTWIKIWTNPTNDCHYLTVYPDQLNAAQQLISDTLKEMSDLQQIEQRLQQLQ